MRTAINRFFSEPLIQFFILGGLLFMLFSYVQNRTNRQAREIVVDKERVGMMLMNYRAQTGNLPTKTQLEALIEQYIQDEMLYREARKMGLDKDDEIIRRRLVQKMDFLQSDLTVVAPPTEAELMQHYQNNPALFSTAPSVGFSHVYFSTDHVSDSLAKQKARVVLQQLQQSGLERAPDMGDRFALQYDYTHQAAVDVQQNFGDSPMLEALFNAPLRTWTGPVQSGYGWHLVYISSRDSSTVLPFASVRQDVQDSYTAAARAKLNAARHAQLREQYVIKRAYSDTQ